MALRDFKTNQTRAWRWSYPDDNIPALRRGIHMAPVASAYFDQRQG
jgi:hypothetical protein